MVSESNLLNQYSILKSSDRSPPYQLMIVQGTLRRSPSDLWKILSKRSVDPDLSGMIEDFLVPILSLCCIFSKKQPESKNVL